MTVSCKRRDLKRKSCLSFFARLGRRILNAHGPPAFPSPARSHPECRNTEVLPFSTLAFKKQTNQHTLHTSLILTLPHSPVSPRRLSFYSLKANAPLQITDELHGRSHRAYPAEEGGVDHSGKDVDTCWSFQQHSCPGLTPSTDRVRHPGVAPLTPAKAVWQCFKRQSDMQHMQFWCRLDTSKDQTLDEELTQAFLKTTEEERSLWGRLTHKQPKRERRKEERMKTVKCVGTVRSPQEDGRPSQWRVRFLISGWWV